MASRYWMAGIAGCGCLASFRREAGRAETAIDDMGFDVDFLRRQVAEGDPHPFRFTANQDDLWHVQAERAAVLTSTPVFKHLVMSATGRMALMRTIDPAGFETRQLNRRKLTFSTKYGASPRRNCASSYYF